MPDFGMSPLLTMPAEAAPEPNELKSMTLRKRFAISARDAMNFNPINLASEVGRVRSLAEGTDATTYSVKELQEMYSASMPGMDWSKYRNNTGRVNKSVVDALYDRQVRNAAYSELVSSNYDSFLGGTVNIAGALAGSMLDPVNIAVGLIPIGGESAIAARLAGTGVASAARTAGVRFLAGAGEDMLLNGTLLQPAINGVRRSLGDDPTFQEYMANVAIGGLLGGTVRAGFGYLSDSIRAGFDRYRASSPTESRVSNMTPSDIDAVSLAKYQAQARGMEGDIEPVLNRSRSFGLSTITPAERAYGTLASEYRTGIRTVAPEDITVRKRGSKYVATTEINGLEIRTTATTARQARANMQKRVVNSLKKFEPNVTRENNMYVAQYTKDRGPLGQTRGYGRTRDEAIANLNRVYDDALNGTPESFGKLRAEYDNVVADRADYAKLQRYIETGERPEFTSHNADTYNAIVDNLEATRAQLIEAGELTPEQINAVLTEAVNNYSGVDLDNAIREANLSNLDTPAFNLDTLENEAQLAGMVSEALKAENPRVREDINMMRQTARDAESFAKVSKTLSQYAENQANMLTSSEGFISLDPEVQERLLAKYNEYTRDSEIFNSKEFEDAVNKFEACRRGL